MNLLAWSCHFQNGKAVQNRSKTGKVRAIINLQGKITVSRSAILPVSNRFCCTVGDRRDSQTAKDQKARLFYKGPQNLQKNVQLITIMWDVVKSNVAKLDNWIKNLKNGILERISALKWNKQFLKSFTALKTNLCVKPKEVKKRN